MRDGDPIEVPDNLKDVSDPVETKCPMCGSAVHMRIHGLRDVAAYGDESLASKSYAPKPKEPDYYVFSEEGYPEFSEDWQSELQEPLTIEHLNLISTIMKRQAAALKTIGALVDNPHWTIDRKYRISEIVRKAK